MNNARLWREYYARPIGRKESSVPVNIVNVGYRSTNYYILVDSMPRLLVDAGWPGTLSTMQHTCNRMGIRLEDIQYQLVTHYHPDHAGLAQELRHLGVRLIVLQSQLAISNPSNDFHSRIISLKILLPLWQSLHKQSHSLVRDLIFLAFCMRIS